MSEKQVNKSNKPRKTAAVGIHKEAEEACAAEEVEGGENESRTAGEDDIGTEAFAESGLSRITIPAGVVKIGYNAFANCSALTEIRFEITEGWWYTSSSTATSGTAIDSALLSDPASAATAMVTTYKGYYLKRA